MLRQIQQGDPRVAPGRMGGTASGSDTGPTGLNGRCDECGSTYRAQNSQVSALCPECAHQLYGYPPCPHRFAAGRCEICGWDGSVSPYLLSLIGKGKTFR